MGATAEGREPKEVQRGIDKGIYDNILKEE